MQLKIVFPIIYSRSVVFFAFDCYNKKTAEMIYQTHLYILMADLSGTQYKIEERWTIKMNVREMRNEALGARVVKALESRNMEAYYVKTKEEALAKALELIPEGSSVSWGGTMSAGEIGLLDAVRAGNYVVLDRDVKETREEQQEVMHQALNCDVFLGSTNAVTEDGILVNIDGNANRVAAYAYGPKTVLLIVGMNKVVKTEADAMSRAKNEAAPINAQRFGIQTPCVKSGTCADCKSPECICCQILITRFSKVPKRTKVILVDENLGF